MKTTLSITLRSLSPIVLVIASSPSVLATELPPTSTLQIQPRGGNAISVAITNPGDQVWIIQRSSDFVHWNEFSTWKVHNGSFHSTFDSGPSSPNVFRAFYDPARQDILSTTENALLLPAPSFNYANPILPPSFYVPPIVGQDNMPATNVTTDAGATLGRVLFYDKRLSTNQTISCSSCHQQQHGFSDSRKFSPVSTAV